MGNSIAKEVYAQEVRTQLATFFPNALQGEGYLPLSPCYEMWVGKDLSKLTLGEIKQTKVLVLEILSQEHDYCLNAQEVHDLQQLTLKLESLALLYHGQKVWPILWLGK